MVGLHLVDHRIFTCDEQLCFALYAASRAMTARHRPLLSALGVAYPQYLATAWPTCARRWRPEVRPVVRKLT